MYPKKTILTYKEFSAYRDILAVILEDDKLYSIDEAQRMLDEFLNREVD